LAIDVFAAYNVLNLPKKVTFAEPGVYNEYVYSADGTKLTVFHKKASSEVRTDYVGNMIYKNDSILDMILMDGGYIKDGQYHFFLQDHLGSNRVVARADGTVVQTNHYYPYGTPFAESYAPDVQDRKYIGKEYDTDNGLDWYDVEARMMDGLRFTTRDPLAEKYYSISPYVYCMGNPMKYVDPTGKDWVVANGTSNYEWRDDITAKSTLPEGYQYVGANNSDILNHMGLSHSLPTQKSNLPGMIAADAEVGRYSAAHMINVRTTSNVIIDANTSFNKDNATENNSMGRTFNGISVKVLETSTNTGAEGKVVAAAEVKLEYGGNTYVTNLKRAEGPQVMPQGSTVSHATINIPKSQLIYGTIPSSLQVRGNWFVSTPGGMTPITIPAGPLSPFFTQYFTHKWTFK
jgi:RHS repeat-associated protein